MIKPSTPDELACAGPGRLDADADAVLGRRLDGVAGDAALGCTRAGLHPR
ncbi:hypothetical protein AB0G15_07475 [Streptosporangium sp. NPDC023825]